MKKFIVLFILVFFVGMNSTAFAHQPKEVLLDYDQETGQITVTVIHPTPSPDTHYIDRIEILVNGDMVLDAEPPRQGPKELTVTYPIPRLNSKDQVIAVAFCNRWGEKRGEITIP